ncbi:TPA: hypothetical protein DCE37_19390 [Candidatus Latescibacteria bacterium]|mgnify:CR=1 FL=1|nr:hypothetical protein [Candidatus Latescibacterota bacterium]|tara:strand:- start:214 stop:429 length:216 start_codon:yes stop_codon:yes gene_type:complete
MPKEDKRQKIGTIIVAIVVVALGAVIYFVVSGQWGTKRFRGIEKFRGDRIEQVDESVRFAHLGRPAYYLYG